MNNLVKRDTRKRESYKKTELSRLLSKTVLCYVGRCKLSKSLKLKQIMLKGVSSTSVSNRCIVSGRGRSLLKNNGYSRIVFRSRANAGLCNGIFRAKW